MPCLHCNRQLIERNGIHYHADGGGRIWYRCKMPGCRWGWACVTEPLHCPKCGECGVHEDHMAEPRESEVRDGRQAVP